MKALNIGVVGLGNIGQKHCESLAQVRQANLVAVSDINTQVVEKTAVTFKAAAYERFEDLLAHPGLEAVIVALPDQLHRDAVILAAQAGKHVLVEKPIATTEADAREMIEAADQANVKLMVGFTLRFIPHYIQAKNAVSSGKLGDVVSVFARRLNVISQAERIGGRTGVLHFLGIHDFDMLRWVVGSEPVSIYTEASTSVPRVYPSENETFSVIKFANGVVGCAHIGWNLPNSYPAGRDFKLDIVGNKGALNVDLTNQGIGIYTADGAKMPSTSPALVEEDKAFVNCVLDDTPVPVTGNDGVMALRMVTAALESIETKMPVSLA